MDNNKKVCFINGRGYKMAGLKKLPIGIENFEKLRQEDFYYIDKTRLIEQLLTRWGEVNLFTRPRRFGKSLNMSMLQSFFEIGKDKTLFDGLRISDNQELCEEYQGKFPVVSVSLKGINGATYEVARRFLIKTINEEARRLSVLSDSAELDETDHELLTQLKKKEMTNDSLVYSIRELTELLEKHYGRKVIVLIDEYDNFTNQLLTAYNDPLYEEVTTADSFLRTFFKVIKKGIGEGSIRTCFCTGVLPVTMDDLTSGYNIAEILTLEPNFLNMLGFTYEETETYLRYVLDKYAAGQDRYDEIWQLIVSNYDGYRFRPNGERLFNSTILTYFFKKFAANAGSIPDELVDENLRTDINWIRRLTLSLDNAKKMLDALVIDDELPYNVADLSSKFNKRKFFNKEFYPVSLFYLGMTTLKDNYVTTLPNMTMRSVYMDYYNQLNQIEGNAQRYVPVYRKYDADRRLEPLVQNYFEQYLGQFLAQVFDKINENFIRCSFYELVSRYLSSCYTFAIEQNNSAGRSDFEMAGIPGTDYYTDDRVVEFKYYRGKDAERMLSLSEPLPEHVEQVKGYAEDTKRKFPNYNVRTYVVYICSNKGWKCWEVY